MVEDRNYLKVRRYILTFVFLFFFSEASFSENLSFTKITNLDNPWGSSFINEDELSEWPMDGWRRCDWWLRQEYARWHDRHCSNECSCDLRLWRNH